MGKSLFKDVSQKNALALILGSTRSYLKLDEISCLLGGEATMIELADYITGGKYSAAEAKIEAAEVRAEVAEAKAKAEIAEAKAEAETEKTKAEARVKLVKSVFKMKINNFDLPTISSVVGLSIDEIEQILN
ncbi:MAG: hypothetical protein LBP22_14070 [Deltaproteobacteria bacterium]|nr:hypothetical protein [Deltaproteobacteria bacterium]